MDRFDERVAVVTGGGAGIGAELALALHAAGAHVAICDLDATRMDEIRSRAQATPAASRRMTAHVCDVADSTQVTVLYDDVLAAHETDRIHVLINNAGVTGGNSFIAGDRDEWDRTFAVCWGGVYNVTRAFLPALVAADEGLILNVASINGLWASLGSRVPHTAYSTAKFAVRGFTESLIEDLRTNAPHLQVALALPGHVATGIIENSFRAHARHDAGPSGSAVAAALSADYIERAPLSARQAAEAILRGVTERRWRILVGEDAVDVDRAVRSDPEGAYGDGGLSVPTFAWTGNVPT